MIEKFYIVKNEKLLKELNDFFNNKKKRNAFVKDFFNKNNISGTGYYICGSGLVNCPFNEKEMNEIVLYIDDCVENNELFGNQLLKRKSFGDSYLRAFRKRSFVLKDFQQKCVEEKIVINSHFPFIGGYFKEFHCGGCSRNVFEYNGDLYLRITTSKFDSITPIENGFNEIKGSQYYDAYEKFKEGGTN